MSADGRDGFAWGLALWATHDGGSTWTLVTAGPGRRTVFGRGIAVGDHDVWALRRSQGTSSSWRSALGSDTWQRVVDAPRLRDIVSLSPLVSGDQVAFQVSGEGGSGNALVVGRPGSWREVAIPFGTEVHVRTDGTTVWASNPEPQGLRLSRLSDGSWQDLGRVDARSWCRSTGSGCSCTGSARRSSPITASSRPTCTPGPGSWHCPGPTTGPTGC